MPVGTVSSANRITGMASGLDVDSIVTKMMAADNTKLDQIKQQRQLVQWKQDTYRDILSDMKTFSDTYFDVLKTDSYMLSENSYASYNVTATDSGSVNNPVSATATAGAGTKTGTYVLSNVTMAARATAKGSVISTETGTSSITASASAPLIISSINDNFKVTVNGTSYNVKLADKTYTDINSFVTDLNNSLKTATTVKEGTTTDISGQLTAQLSPDGTKLQFTTGSTSNGPSNVSISNNDGSNFLSKVGFTGSSVDVITTSGDKMSTIFAGKASFSINGINFNYDFSSNGANKDWTISQVLNDINTKTSTTNAAGNDLSVKASYSDLSRTLSIQSSGTGSKSSESFSWTDNADTNKFMNLFGVSGTASNGVVNVTKTGTDASVTIKNPEGVTATVVRSTNTFVVDGMTYTLNSNNTTTNTNINVTADSSKTYDKIKSFIDKYNTMIDKIQTKITEKKNYDYKPLTDAQKKAMTDDDIKAWNTKAEAGVLKNDSMLQNMLYSMRGAFYQSVQSAGLSLNDIGLSTSSDYTQGGKIIIDDTKLKTAIQNKGDQVEKIFMNQSNIDYSADHTNTSGDGRAYSARYNEEGIFQRINDIVKDYSRLTRDTSGKKGLLVEEAGVTGDLSQYTNTLSKSLTNDYDKKITQMTKDLATKQEQYYQKFSKLEATMQSLNDQQNSLAAMLK